MKTRLFMTMAAATLVLASCSKENENPETDWNGEILLSSGVNLSVTRAGTAPDTQIASGQEVGVFINEAATPENAIGTNLKYNANGSGGLTLVNGQEQPYYPTGKDGSVKIYAYQPYQADATSSTTCDFTVLSNQNTAKSYYDSDLLYSATKTYIRSTAVKELIFDHKLSKIICTLTADDGSTDLTGATVSVVNAKTKVTFTHAGGTVATQEGTSSDITLNKDITAGSYIGVVPPQTFAKGSQLLKVELNNGDRTTLYYTLPNEGGDSNLVLESKNVYTFDITLNISEGTITLSVSSSVNPWISDAGNNYEGTANKE